MILKLKLLILGLILGGAGTWGALLAWFTCSRGFSPIPFILTQSQGWGKGGSVGHGEVATGWQLTLTLLTLLTLTSAQFNCCCFGESPETFLYNLSVISLFLKPQQNPEALGKQGSSPVSTASIPKASAPCRTWPFFATSPIKRQINDNSSPALFPR